MLVATIAEKSLSAVSQKIKDLKDSAEAIELRLDVLEEIDFNELAKLRSTISLPLIFTLRKVSQGGCYKKSEKTRKEEIKKLASLSPTYVDLEVDLSSSFVYPIRKFFPDVKIILSYHHFQKVPKKPLFSIRKNEKEEWGCV